MMMTSGSGVNYKSMFDAGSQIVAKEGTKSLFKGAGANILRGVAGAGVLSLYDKLQEVMFGKVYSGGACASNNIQAPMLIFCYRIRLGGFGHTLAILSGIPLHFFLHVLRLPLDFIHLIYRVVGDLSYIRAMHKFLKPEYTYIPIILFEAMNGRQLAVNQVHLVRWMCSSFVRVYTVPLIK
jgi:hypothetical protein